MAKIHIATLIRLTHHHGGGPPAMAAMAALGAGAEPDAGLPSSSPCLASAGPARAADAAATLINSDGKQGRDRGEMGKG